MTEAPDTRTLVRHRARGTTYRVAYRGVALQTSRALEEGERLVVYLGQDGHVWARPEREFDDGRFEPLPEAPTAGANPS